MNGLSNALGGRELLDRVTKIGFIAAIALWFLGQISANAAEANPLNPPANVTIRVALLISEDAVLSHVCGRWEVLRVVIVRVAEDNSFRLYSLSQPTSLIG